MNEGLVVEKAWGKEVYLTSTPLYTAKQLHVRKGFICSLHRHTTKDETFIVSQGQGGLQLGADIYDLREGDVIHVPPGTVHRFWAVHEELVLLEVSTQHLEEDVERVIESGPLKRGININAQKLDQGDRGERG